MSVRTDVINLNVNINGNDAQNNLNELRKKAADIKFEMEGLKKNTQEYIKKKAELKQVTDAMADLKKTIGITALTQKELTQELTKLKSLRGSVVPFSDEYKELSKQIKVAENRLYDVRNGVQGFASTLSKVKDEVKQFGVAAAAYLGFEFITSQFSNIIRGAGKLSDSLANIQRVTGLTADETKNLNKQLSGLETRTSTEGLRNIAIIAGKLGVAKDDLYEFTKAVDHLVVALGDELGDADQITTQLGKILNVFDGKVTGEGLTKLGNAFVELANTGAATGGFIADFDQRLSGIAKSSGISLGALSGLGAGLEEMGGKVESSSTAIQKLIITIASDLPGAAKIAGKSTEEFTSLFSKDPTEALLQYSQGLVKNKQSFAEITAAFKDAGEEGARTIETLTKLGTNADTLRGRIDLGKKSIQESTATNSAFELKNQTLGATIDKLGKDFNRFITSSTIVNFVKSLIGYASDFIKLLSAIPKFINDNSTALKFLAAGILLLNLSYIKNAVVITASTIAKIRDTIATRASALATTVAEIAQAQYIVVTNLLTKRIGFATAAQRLWNIAISAGLGPVGVLISVIGAAVVAYSLFSGAGLKTNSIMSLQAETFREANKEISKQKAEIDELTAVITSKGISDITQEATLKRLIALSPEYLNRLTLENIATADGKRILDAYNKSLQASANIKAANAIQERESAEDIRLRTVKQELEILKTTHDFSALGSDAKDAYAQGSGTDQIASALKIVEDKINKQSGNVKAATQNFVNQTKNQEGARREFLLREIGAAKQAMIGLDQNSEAYKNATSKLIEARNKFNEEFGNKNTAKSDGANPLLENTSKTLAKLKTQLQELDKAYENIDVKDIAALRKNRDERKKIQDEINAIEGKKSPGEKAASNKGESLREQSLKRAADFENKRLESKKKYDKEIEDADLATLKAQYENQELNFDQRLASLQAFHNKQLEQIKKEKEDNDALLAQEIAEEKKKKGVTPEEKKKFAGYVDQKQKDNAALAAKENAKAEIEYSNSSTKIILENTAKWDKETAAAYESTKKHAQDAAKFQEALSSIDTDNKLLALDKKFADGKIKNVKEYQKQREQIIKAADEKQLEYQLSSLQNLQKILRAAGLSNIEIEKLIADAEVKINKAKNDKKIADDEASKEKRQKLIQEVSDTANKVLDIAGNIATALNNRDQKQFNKEKSLNDAKAASYKKQLDRKLLSQAQYDKKIAALNAEQDKKKHELELKAFKRQQALAVAKVIVSTAVGIAESFPNIFKMAFIALAGAAEIIAIKSAEPPQAAEGNWFQDGKKHKDGGINVEIEKDEAVMKADAMTSPDVVTVTGTTAQITSALNSRKGGVNWAGGATLLDMPAWRTQRPAQINPNMPRIMEQGGVVRPLPVSNQQAPGAQNNDALVTEMKGFREDINNWSKNIKGQWIIKDLDDTRTLFDKAKNASGLNQ